MTLPPCPECKQSKWATRTARNNFREKVLHCMECGFEVDLRVAKAARRILRHAGKRDMQPAETAPTQGNGE